MSKLMLLGATLIGLLRNIAASPDDDDPRLVLADYLQENGEPELAEFVRLQVWMDRWANLTVPGSPPDPSRLRADELLRRHAGRWTALLPDLHRCGYAFHRGLPVV